MKLSFKLTVCAIFSVAFLQAQELVSCKSQPSQAHVRAWQSPNSIFNKRLNYVKKIPDNDLKKIKSIVFKNNTFTKILSPSPKNPSNRELLGVTRRIPIAAHIVRRSNGTGGLSDTDLQASLDRANVAYAGLNLMFYIDEIKYIDSNSKYNTYYDYEILNEVAGLSVTTENIKRKLNIYFVPRASTSWANFPSKKDAEQHILMNISHTRNESTLAHELGHWFDLWHTHETVAGDERVSGSNCSTAGDQICDTPADPSLSGKVNSSCSYTGNSKDANGDTYVPNPRNMMSYSLKKCRTFISNGQMYRAQSAYLGMQSDRGYTFGNASNSVIKGFGSAMAVGDFDGDGNQDFVVGAKDSENGEGRVYIYRGDSNSFPVFLQTIDQSGLGMNEKGDLFGASMAVGDFNGDGKDDLAIGLPGESPGSSPKSGSVNIYKGTSSGLIPWKGLDQSGIGMNERGDLFGAALASGDFNGDGKDDLAIGLPGEAPDKFPKSGYVMIFKGTTTGPTYQHGLDQAGLGNNENDDQFGFSLASGDFNGDGRDDLAVGLPGEAPNNDPKSGLVMIFKGGASKLTPWQSIDQKGLGNNENGDRFGASLAAGDFNGDGKDDLAVGLPGEAPDSDPKSGIVMTFKGSSTRLNPWQSIDQKGLGINENGDLFGSSIAAGDINGDGKDDLVVGLPGEAPNNDPKSGYIMTYKGSSTKLTPWQGIDQKGLGSNERNDLFGASLAMGDLNGDGKCDLLVAAINETPGNSIINSGSVFIFKGGLSKLSPHKGINP